MSVQVVECVPNFSEGRREDVVEAIASAIRNCDGCSLLDVDPGASTNRTVYTFVGPPGAVLEGALAAAKVAFQMIDMTKQKGEHPRIGALDVCPFIPVANITMEECVELSRRFGSRLATELKVPVFLYECSSSQNYRETLSQIRSGEYEGLEEKLKQAEWAPDFGPPEFVPSWGATVTGARNFLIAYNVNILGTKEQAHRIALLVRQDGKPSQRGRLKGVKAIGWYLEEKGIAQVSMNVCDYETTPLYKVYVEVCYFAKTLNVAVAGSEVVGLLPLKAVMMTAEHYIEKEKLFILHERQRVLLAATRLGLSSIAEFKPEEKIIEYKIDSHKDGPLVSSTLRAFVEAVGSRTSAPGGGSVSAAAASLGAALGTMVGLMTFGRKKFESVDSIMRENIQPLHRAMLSLLPLVDDDSKAFTDYLLATKLPQETEEQKTRRSEAMDSGLKNAIAVPRSVMTIAMSCWPRLLSLVPHCNFNVLSDLQVGSQTLHAGIYGAYYNVCINLPHISDVVYVGRVRGEVEEEVRRSQEFCKQVLDAVEARLKSGETA